ncbi:hypothetical protein C8J56DRAFT_891635 [Mycena floridula]|nr:hypothetical protein C8J56DRAFT_891635 [Mycena floridula]
MPVLNPNLLAFSSIPIFLHSPQYPSSCILLNTHIVAFFSQMLWRLHGVFAGEDPGSVGWSRTLSCGAQWIGDMKFLGRYALHKTASPLCVLCLTVGNAFALVQFSLTNTEAEGPGDPSSLAPRGGFAANNCNGFHTTDPFPNMQLICVCGAAWNAQVYIEPANMATISQTNFQQPSASAPNMMSTRSLANFQSTTGHSMPLASMVSVDTLNRRLAPPIPSRTFHSSGSGANPEANAERNASQERNFGKKATVFDGPVVHYGQYIEASQIPGFPITIEGLKQEAKLILGMTYVTTIGEFIAAQPSFQHSKLSFDIEVNTSDVWNTLSAQIDSYCRDNNLVFPAAPADRFTPTNVSPFWLSPWTVTKAAKRGPRYTFNVYETPTITSFTPSALAAITKTFANPFTDQQNRGILVIAPRYGDILGLVTSFRSPTTSFIEPENPHGCFSRFALYQTPYYEGGWPETPICERTICKLALPRRVRRLDEADLVKPFSLMTMQPLHLRRPSPAAGDNEDPGSNRDDDLLNLVDAHNSSDEEHSIEISDASDDEIERIWLELSPSSDNNDTAPIETTSPAAATWVPPSLTPGPSVITNRSQAVYGVGMRNTEDERWLLWSVGPRYPNGQPSVSGVIRGLMAQGGAIRGYLAQIGTHSYNVGTARTLINIESEFMNLTDSFIVLGLYSTIMQPTTQATSYLVSMDPSPLLHTHLSSLNVALNTPAFMLLIYPKPEDEEDLTTEPSLQASGVRNLSIPFNIKTYLDHHAGQHKRDLSIWLHEGEYGTAYQHVLHVHQFDCVCKAINLDRRAGSPSSSVLVTIQYQNVSISFDHIAAWLGLVPSTLATRRTDVKNFKRARDRLVMEFNHTERSRFLKVEEHKELLDILNALLTDNILPPVASFVGVLKAGQEAESCAA